MRKFIRAALLFQSMLKIVAMQSTKKMLTDNLLTTESVKPPATDLTVTGTISGHVSLLLVTIAVIQISNLLQIPLKVPLPQVVALAQQLKLQLLLHQQLQKVQLKIRPPRAPLPQPRKKPLRLRGQQLQQLPLLPMVVQMKQFSIFYCLLPQYIEVDLLQLIRNHSLFFRLFIYCFTIF